LTSSDHERTSPLLQASIAVKYVNDPGQIESVGVEVIRKLVTPHVRQERFCEGHLLAMFKNGHILALLRRLKQIREQGMTTIVRFTGDYDFLSNFHPSPIQVDGVVYR
jgi:hypothetical protein